MPTSNPRRAPRTRRIGFHSPFVEILILAVVVLGLVFNPAILVVFLVSAAPGIFLYFAGVARWGWFWVKPESGDPGVSSPSHHNPTQAVH
jgi:hypothetical protein